jgi:hypothetical protein
MGEMIMEKLIERLRDMRDSVKLDSVYDKRSSTAEYKKVTVVTIVKYSSM